MSHAPRARSGLVAGGNWIVDHVKLIDTWPPQDALASILGESHSNGGSAYNILKNLAKLGAAFPLAGIGLIGDDEAGRTILADCAAHGIDATRLRVTREAATSYTDVMTVRATGRRTFFHQRGANALLAPGHFDFAGSTARIFHLGYLLLLDTLDALRPDGTNGAAEVLRRARAAGLRTSLDCVSEHSDRFAAVAQPVLPEVDYLFANEFEAAKLTGVAIREGAAFDRAGASRAGRQLLAAGVRERVFIHTPAGVLAVGRDGGEAWQPSVRVPASEIKGAAGAGDALAAGVLLGLHEEWPLAESLRLGVACAAASLADASCSAGVRPIAECLALAERRGFSAAAP